MNAAHGNRPRTGGRVSQDNLEAMDALRKHIDMLIDAEAARQNTSFNAVYVGLGLGETPLGRGPNLWNLYTHVKKNEWIAAGKKVGPEFTKEVAKTYADEVKCLDAQATEDLRKELMSKAKEYVGKEEGGEVKSMNYARKAIEKAVSFFYILLAYF